jgi:hypothetical protein
MGIRVIAHLHLVRDVPLGHGSPNVLWLRPTPVTVNWFAGRTWKNNISDIRIRLTYCVGFIVHTRFLNVTAVPVTRPGWPQVEDPCFRTCTVTI